MPGPWRIVLDSELCLLSVPEDPDSPEQVTNIGRYLEGLANGLNNRELELRQQGVDNRDHRRRI